MKKSIFSIIGALFLASFVFVACEETEGVADPYTDWEVRNQAYIDSIAEVAKNNPSEWKIIHTWKFNETLGDLNSDVNDYVYCKVLESGNGAQPLFTNTVSVNYRGWLIPLYDGSIEIFDQSYMGQLNRDVAMPVDFALNSEGLRVGWSTALMQMKVGDRWEVYIPYTLGYESYGSGTIPGYSTLIFDIDLVKVY